VEQWWPLLLIGLGLIALAEWAIDLRRENPPVRRFGGYIWLVILLIILGTGGAGWHRWWGRFGLSSVMTMMTFSTPSVSPNTISISRF